MSFNEKMTVIADNIRAKTLGTEALTLENMASGVNEVYEKGKTDENTEISNAFRDTTFARNLFDKDNYEIFKSWGVNDNAITITDTGLSWTNLNFGKNAGNLMLKFGLAKDYAGKTLTLSTKQFYSKFTQILLCKSPTEEISGGSLTYAGIKQDNGTYIHRLKLDKSGYTDEVIVIRLYFSKEHENIVFDEIMVHDHYDALQPYVPYGYVPDVGTVEDYSREVSDLYEKGTNDHILETMRLVQGYGSRTNYEYAFYSNRDWGYWNPTTFYPQYDIKGTAFTRAFYAFGADIYLNKGLDLSARLEECGVVLDTSNATTLNNMFNNSTLTRVPALDCRNCNDETGLQSVLGYNNIVTVDKMIVKRTLKYPSSFSASYGLENIIFEGEIGQDISFSNSPLTLESVKNIIEHLADYSAETTGTYILTLKDECKTALEADTETVEFNGQSYTYLNLMGAKRWSLA